MGDQGLYHPMEPQRTQASLSTGESHPTPLASPAPALSACPRCPQGSEEQAQREVDLYKGFNQHFLAQVKHWQVQACLSLVHLGHQTLEEDSAAVSGPGSTVPSQSAA